jgi:hypothetical protein
MLRYELKKINWLEKLALAGVAFYFAVFLFYGAVCLFYPYDLDNEEGFILNQIHQLRHGHTIYPELKAPPYTVGNYPPVYQVVNLPFSLVFGTHHWYGRLISILATLVLGYLIGRIVYRITEDIFTALVAGIFPFAVHYIYSWAVLNRVDMLALAFTLAGIYKVFKEPKKIVVPVILFLLAFYTKQTMIAAPVIAFFYIFLNDPKKAGLFAVSLGLSGLMVFLTLYGLTHGEFFYHLVLYNMNPFRWSSVWNYLTNMVHFYWPFFLIVLIGFFVHWGRDWKLLFGGWFLLSALVAISAGKDGSAVNYLIEMFIAGSILAGVSLSELRKSVVWGQYILAGLVFYQLILIPHFPYTRYWYGPMPDRARYNRAKSVEEIVRNTPGPVLSDDAALLLRAGKPVLFQPFIMSTLDQQHLWNSAPLVQDIQNRKFSLVILYFPLSIENARGDERYSPAIYDALRFAYQPVDYRAPYFIHQPR